MIFLANCNAASYITVRAVWSYYQNGASAETRAGQYEQRSQNYELDAICPQGG